MPQRNLCRRKQGAIKSENRTRFCDRSKNGYVPNDINPASSPTISLPFIQNLACIHMGMTMEEVLIATTIHAAYAINRGGEIGSLERGKKADILILNVSNYKQLQYFYEMNHTDTFIKNGKVVVRRGVLL